MSNENYLSKKNIGAKNASKKANTEEKLKDGEEKLNKIFDSISDGILVADIKTKKFFRANKAMCTMLGYSEKELLNLSITDIHSKNDLPFVLKQLKDQITFKKMIATNIPVKRKDGSIFFADVSSAVTHLYGRSYIVGTFRDITEKRTAEKTFSIISKNAKDFIELLPSEDVYEFTGKRLMELTGKSIVTVGSIDVENKRITVKQLLGFNKHVENILVKMLKIKNMNSLMSIDFSVMAEEIKANAGTIHELDGLYDGMFRTFPKSLCEIIQRMIGIKKVYAIDFGRNKQVYANAAIFMLEDKPINQEILESFVYQASLVFERKTAEDNLNTYKNNLEVEVKKRISFLNSIVENVPDMIFVKDAKELRFDLINKAGEDLLGVKRKDLIGKNDYDFFPNAQANFFIKKDREVLKNKKLLDIPEEPIYTRVGLKYLHTKKIPILDENTNPRYLLGISEDITEKKDYVAKLKESFNKLQEADILKSKFLSITSHELKTPLTPAKIQSQMLLQGDLGPLNEKQKKGFDIILRNINRLNRLIEDILEISRLEAEGFKLELEETQLTRLIKPIITGLAPVAEKKGLKLFYVQHGNLPKLFVDKKRITEVITNLIDNAIKFTEVGQITVETRRRKNNILVKVSDSGCGIPEEFYSKIFEPFSQAEGMVNRTHGGTGLGLSICKGIVKQHKGDIWFESKIGKGTTFYFILPLPKERLSFSMLNYVIHMLF